MNKLERQEKVKNVIQRLNVNTYEYYPIIVKKPTKYLKLRQDFVEGFSKLFSTINISNSLDDKDFDYVITVSLDKEEDLLLVLVSIVEKDGKVPPMIDYNMFFYKDEEEKKLFLNFIYSWNIIFEPHEYNVLLFDGKKYTDKEFIGVQKKWITTLFPT